MDDEDQGEWVEQLFETLKGFKFPSLKPQRPWVEVVTKRSQTRGLNFEGATRALYGDHVHHAWHKPIPENIYEATMSAAPNQTIPLSYEERESRREDLIIAVQEVFLSLTDDEQWLYQMLVDWGLTLRSLAQLSGIPKTSLARIRDELAHKLRDGLLEQKVVQEYLSKSNPHHES